MGLFDFFKKDIVRGDYFLELEKSGKGDPKFLSYIKWARSEGVTDSDIKLWWDLPDEQHAKLEQESNIYKIACYKSLLKKGINKNQAINTMKKGFPTFCTSIPDNISDNSPLPYELKPKINNFMNSLSQNKLIEFKKESEKHSSMNAFVRSMIKKGEL